MNIFFTVDAKILVAGLLFNFRTLKDIICVKLTPPYEPLKTHIIFSKTDDHWHCEDPEMEKEFPEAMSEICTQLNGVF